MSDLDEITIFNEKQLKELRDKGRMLYAAFEKTAPEGQLYLLRMMVFLAENALFYLEATRKAGVLIETLTGGELTKVVQTVQQQ